MESENINQTEAESFEELGIEKIPYVMKRQRHNFDELTFDEHGDIIIDDDEDKDDDYSVSEPVPSKRKRKTRIDDEDIQPSKKTKPTSFECEKCGTTFSRKLNLTRHIKSKH